MSWKNHVVYRYPWQVQSQPLKVVALAINDDGLTHPDGGGNGGGGQGGGQEAAAAAATEAAAAATDEISAAVVGMLFQRQFEVPSRSKWTKQGPCACEFNASSAAVAVARIKAEARVGPNFSNRVTPFPEFYNEEPTLPTTGFWEEVNSTMAEEVILPPPCVARALRAVASPNQRRAAEARSTSAVQLSEAAGGVTQAGFSEECRQQ